MDKKRDKLQIVCKDIANHPHCEHGPTLLFARTRKSAPEEPEYFFGCSACRSRKYCPFWSAQESLETWSKVVSAQWATEHFEFGKKRIDLRNKIKNLKKKYRRYCHDCNTLFSCKDDTADEHTEHNVQVGISDDEMRQPTKLLKAVDHDKTQAQYFFTDKTLEVFHEIFQKLNIRKVICMGAPRLHDYLKTNSKNTRSFLLDIDKRLLDFLADDEFAWYNMFNNYFFLGNYHKNEFEKFLKDDGDGKTLLFVDPPFGCRTEPLTQTIRDIIDINRQINHSAQTFLPVFWIFPYYMETYLKNSMPEMEMSDYKVNYANHSMYSNDKHTSRKFGSPVRIFTNIPLSLIELPAQEGYRNCLFCKRWVSGENQHCKYCRECPSKNGQTYRHCPLCALCVKPNYVHCKTCGRCTQVTDHSCDNYQNSLNCWICRKSGHSEKKCNAWVDVLKAANRYQNISGIKKGKRRCLICNVVGHNEKRCPRRRELLDEVEFLGEVSNVFSHKE